jgi:hypothetical protein
MKKNLPESVVQLSAVLRERKFIRKQTKRKCTYEVVKKMRDEYIANLKVTKFQSSGSRTIESRGNKDAIAKSGINKTLENIESMLAVLNRIIQATDNEMDIDDVAQAKEEPDDLDVEVVNDAAEAALEETRQEPTQWNGTADEVIVCFEAEPGDDEVHEEAADPFQAREAAIVKFAMLASIPNSNLKCIRCALDSTASPFHKTKRYMSR